MYAGPTQRGMSERLTRASFAQELGVCPLKDGTGRRGRAYRLAHRGLHMPLIIVVVNARGASPVSAFEDGVGSVLGLETRLATGVHTAIRPQAPSKRLSRSSPRARRDSPPRVDPMPALAGSSRGPDQVVRRSAWCAAPRPESTRATDDHRRRTRLAREHALVNQAADLGHPRRGQFTYRAIGAIGPQDRRRGLAVETDEPQRLAG